MKKDLLNVAVFLFVAMGLLTYIFSACVDQPVIGPSGFEAEAGGGGSRIPPPSSNPGDLVVEGMSDSGTYVSGYVRNESSEPGKIRFCTWDCGETGDCRTALQKLYRDRPYEIPPGQRKYTRAKLSCDFQWDVLRPNDPRETLEVTCPETYRWGQDYPGLERLASGVGHRDDAGCIPVTTTIPKTTTTTPTTTTSRKTTTTTRPPCQIPAKELCFEHGGKSDPATVCGWFDMIPMTRDEDCEGTCWNAIMDADLAVVKGANWFHVYPDMSRGDRLCTCDRPTIVAYGPTCNIECSNITYCACP